MNYYNNVKHLITQKHIDVNYEIESTVKYYCSALLNV